MTRVGWISDRLSGFSMGFGKVRPLLQMERIRGKPKLRGWAFALLLAAVSSPSQSLWPHASVAPNAASAHAIHGMPPTEAAHRYPVHLRAVLTFYDPYVDPRRGVVFVCDHSVVFLSRYPDCPFFQFALEIF